MGLASDLDKLAAFLAIARAGTLRAAAGQMGLSQPALTKLVQKLEHACGAPLLSRSRAGVQLTPAGEQLAAYAARTLKELEDLEKKIQHPRDDLAGHLRIGAYASLAEYLWPNFLPALRKEAPVLSLSIFTSEAMGQSKALERGEVDLLVDAEPRLPAGEFISFNLYEDRFQFYAKDKNLALQPGVFRNIPLVFSPSAADEKKLRIDDHLTAAAYIFPERIELDSFTAALSFAKAGAGLAVLPQRLAKAAVAAGQIHAVSLKGFSAKGFGTHHFQATMQESRRQDPRLRFLVRRLREWCKP